MRFHGDLVGAALEAHEIRTPFRIVLGTAVVRVVLVVVVVVARLRPLVAVVVARLRVLRDLHALANSNTSVVAAEGEMFDVRCGGRNALRPRAPPTLSPSPTRPRTRSVSYA